MNEDIEMIVAVEMDGSMPKATWDEDDPRPVVLDVIIDDDKAQGTFRMVSDPTTGGVPIVQEYIVEFDNNQNGQYSNGFDVSICLPSDQGKNASWTFDDDPIWAKVIDRHGACPGNKNQNDPNLLTDVSLSADKRTLTFGNANDVPLYFGFALRFKNVANGKTLTYDPIGNNQNGSSFD